MNHYSPAPQEIPQLDNQQTPSSFWGTRYEGLVWAGLIVAAAYLFFGIGKLSGIAVIIMVIQFASTQRNMLAKRIRSLFAKVVITGVAYQFMGFVLISAPNVLNANKFFENADVEAQGVALVDSLNYRKSMHQMQVSSKEFTKLVAFYRAKAEQDKEKEYSFGHPHRFAYFELQPQHLSLKYLDDEIGYDREDFEVVMVNLEKSEDDAPRGDDWLDTRNLLYDIEDLLEGFPEINQGHHGYGRVLVWHGRHGDDRIFIWFEKSETGYLKCQAGFG